MIALEDRKRAAVRAPGRPRATSEEDRRAQLLAAAEHVFLTAGYHAATMNDVARRAGMSKRTVYQVFASKAAMFEALLTDRFKPLTLPVEQHDDRPVAERLYEMLLRMATFSLAPRQVALARLMITEAGQSRDMADALRSLGLGRGGGNLEQWLATEVSRGHLRLASVEDSAQILFFGSVGDALLLTLLQAADPPDESMLARRVGAMVRMFLRDTALPDAA